MKPKLYIAGKITGLPFDEVVQKFNIYEQHFAKRGWEVLNPIKLVNDEHVQWEEAMKICIKAIMDCDAVFMMPCWRESRGAMIEFNLACTLNIPVHLDTMSLLNQQNNKIKLAP